MQIFMLNFQKFTFVFSLLSLYFFLSPVRNWKKGKNILHVANINLKLRELFTLAQEKLNFNFLIEHFKDYS